MSLIYFWVMIEFNRLIGILGAVPDTRFYYLSWCLLIFSVLFDIALLVLLITTIIKNIRQLKK